MKTNDKKVSQNIFCYATSELSQDAFISLLVAWCVSEDKVLKGVSKDFISALYEVYHKKTLDTEKIKSIEIIPQHYKIDVYFKVSFVDGTTIPFIIEDKTWTEPHSNQLSRYVQKVSGVKKYPEERNAETDKIVKIFFKTGHVTEKDRKETKDANYTIVDTKWIYDFLSKYNNIDNIIFRDYREFLTEEFYKKLYNIDGSKKDLKDLKGWQEKDVEEVYVQYAIIEKIKQLVVQEKVEGTTDSYIRYTKNGKFWDTWWSFYQKKGEFSLFVKIKRIDKKYRLRLIRYAANKEHGFKGTKFNDYLDEILKKDTYGNIKKTENPRHKAKETEISFLELADAISLKAAAENFSKFLIDFMIKVKKDN